MQLPIYLDNHASTPCDPRVVESMLPYFTQTFGNAASTAHPYGWKAREAVEIAREQIARLAGSEPGEVIFTSGATEAINMVLKGIARGRAAGDLHIVTAVTEHSAVLDTCIFLEKTGIRITRLSVDAGGRLDLDELEAVLGQGADLVSLMHANNEIGVIHPVEAIAQICDSHNIPLHVDAAQSFGKIETRFREWKINFLSISGHKFYAPKGVGALIVRRQVPPLRLTPLLHGGGHERGFRSGTLNVPGIVGMGKASELCLAEMETEATHVLHLRTDLLNRLLAGIPDMIINGTLEARLPGNLNVSLPCIEAQHLLPALRDNVSLSSGSACTSAKPTPSYVLAAIGRSDELAHASLRFGIGRFNTSDEIALAAESVISAVQKLQSRPEAPK